MPPSLQVSALHRLTGHNGAVYAIADAPAPFDFCSAGGDGWLVGWQLANPEQGRLLAKVEAKIFSALYIKEQNLLLAGDMNGGLHWIYLDEPARTRGLAFHTKGIFDLVQVGDSVFSAGGDGKLARWDLASGRCVESLTLSQQSLRCLAYSPYRDELAVGTSDQQIHLVDSLNFGVKYSIPHAHENSVFTLAYSQESYTLYSGGRDALLRSWALPIGVPAMIFSEPAHWYTLNHLALHPNGRWLASASRDKTIKIWDTENMTLAKVLETVRDKGHINSVNRLWWSPDGHTLISAGDDRSLIQWAFAE